MEFDLRFGAYGDASSSLPLSSFFNVIGESDEVADVEDRMM